MLSACTPVNGDPSFPGSCAKSQGTNSAAHRRFVEVTRCSQSQHQFRSTRRAKMREAKDAKLLKLQMEVAQLRFSVKSQAVRLAEWQSWYEEHCWQSAGTLASVEIQTELTIENTMLCWDPSMLVQCATHNALHMLTENLHQKKAELLEMGDQNIEGSDHDYTNCNDSISSAGDDSDVDDNGAEIFDASDHTLVRWACSNVVEELEDVIHGHMQRGLSEPDFFAVCPVLPESLVDASRDAIKGLACGGLATASRQDHMTISPMRSDSSFRRVFFEASSCIDAGLDAVENWKEDMKKYTECVPGRDSPPSVPLQARVACAIQNALDSLDSSLSDISADDSETDGQLERMIAAEREEERLKTRVRLGCASIVVTPANGCRDFGEVSVDGDWGISSTSIVDDETAACAVHEWCPGTSVREILKMIESKHAIHASDCEERDACLDNG